MTDRAERLAAYLEAANSVKAEWGLAAEADCSSWPAGWIRRERPDVTFPTYSNEDEARTLIKGHGSLAQLWKNVLGEFGISDVRFNRREGEIGDVGVIEMSWGASGCIFGTDGICFIRGDLGARMMRPRERYILARFSL